jgi:hypothetical protein
MSKGKAYCPECRAETPVRTQPIFQGFEKVGEARTCTFCGHAIPEGHATEIPRTTVASKTAADLFGEPYAPPKTVNPFGDEPLAPPKTVNPFGDDLARPAAVNPFGDTQDGPLRICSNCRNYVVNPFTQKCMLHEREVTATDSCDQFELRRK